MKLCFTGYALARMTASGICVCVRERLGMGRLPTGSFMTIDRQPLSDPDFRIPTGERRYLVDRCPPPLGCSFRSRGRLPTTTVAVAAIPLRVSADPTARNKETALRQQAIKDHMSATLAWLDPYGIW